MVSMLPVSQKVYYGSAKVDPKKLTRDGPPPSDTKLTSGSEEQLLKQVTEEMYKHNLELAVKNQTLSVLKALYAITMQSVTIKEVAQRIVDAITAELKFTAVLISLIDYEKKVLVPVAITQSSSILASLTVLGKSLDEIEISTDETNNILLTAIKTNERQITGNVLDILSPLATQEIADEIERLTGIRTLVIYPLFFGGKALGALTLGLSKKADDLSRAEKETIEQLIDLVNISIDRAKLYEDVRIANEKLQELDKLKDEFVSLASHELRTPMTAIKGSISTILDGYAGEVTPQTREFLAAAYNENDRLIRLVNNLLNISRIEAGRFTFTLTPIHMEDLIIEVVKNLQVAAKEKNLYLKFEKDGPIAAVSGDVDKVKEVIINLIGNAIKFTHEGGVTITATQKDKMVITAVTDTGHGISQADQDLLFKKFSQVKGNYTKQTGGTGLGLYICKQIVEGQGGEVWLESTVGKGSTFYFSLPIVS